MSSDQKSYCPDCDRGLSRRDFVRVLGGAAAAGPLLGLADSVQAAPTPKSAAETTVKRFYETLTDKQKETIALPFNHQLRHRISANWAVTEPSIGSDFYTNEQRELIDRIVKDVSSEEGYDKLKRQMADDAADGFNDYHVAVFGKPGTGKFQWELTGRHLTLRADGDNVENMAFGGPIVYGHGEEDPKKNLFHYQTQQANKVFQALDAKQVEKALLAKAPRESDVPLQGDGARFPGVAVGDLSSDQQELVEKTIKVILAPYREEDVDEAIAFLKAGGGLKKLHMAFYQQDDLDKDEVWDIWRLEGPTFVWHFRGAPHVHTYVNIGKKT